MIKLNQELIESVYRHIETRNHAGTNQSIIHSDELYNSLSAQLRVSKDAIHQIIDILLETHKVLRIEIMSEDTNRGIDKIEGFVVAQLGIIKNLKTFFESQLAILYEREYHKSRGAASIIAELFPKIQQINRSEIGQILNKTYMLGEYERMVNDDYAHYSLDWQEKKMIEHATTQGFRWTSSIAELNETNSSIKSEPTEEQTTPEETVTTTPSNRASDTHKAESIDTKAEQYALKRILNIYGLEFFTKIYFRRYEFDYIRLIIEDGQIEKKADLLKIKGYLKTIKGNILKDTKLAQHRDEIYALDKTITHALFIER